MLAKKLKRRVLILSIAFSLSLFPSYSANPPKVGSSCAKKGITKSYKGKNYTCIKSGKKTVWSIAPSTSSKNTPSANPIAPLPSSSPSVMPPDYVDFKSQITYGLRNSELIRKADSGTFFDSDSRNKNSFSLIRQRAFDELNKNPRSREHPNIEFVYDIRPSYPSNLAIYIQRELDEAAALWNRFFKKKLIVNVYMVTEKDREYVKGNPWLQRNLAATSNAPGFKSEFDRFEDRFSRPFVGGGGGFWETNGNWSGNLYFSVASWVDFNNINAEWPVTAKHEFLHVVQDYAFYRNLQDRPRTLHSVVQPTHFREGSANTISFLTSFRNIGWSSDALDWNFVLHTRDFSSWKSIKSEQDAITLMKEMECLKDCEKLSSNNPSQVFFWSYSFGAVMWEWVLGTYGIDGYMRMLDELVTASSFDQVTRAALGLTTDELYSKIAPYILETVQRTNPYGN